MSSTASSMAQQASPSSHVAVLPRVPLWLRPTAGPDASLAGALASVLDVIDLPVLLVNDSLVVRYANRAARLVWQCEGAAFLQGQLLPLAEGQADRLRGAVYRATLGHWSMLTLRYADQAMPVGVTPVANDRAWSDASAVLIVGGHARLSGLARQFFCQEYSLSRAESQVLEGLADGLSPEEIAQRGGVALSTVRTQISDIRAKSQAPSVRHLLQMVGGLPRMLGGAESGLA